MTFDPGTSVVAFGAHPDDIEYGCGAFLSRFEYPAGVIVTDGERGTQSAQRKERRTEAERSAKILRYQPIFLSMPDTRLSAPDLVEPIEQIVERRNPDVVLVHHPKDRHQDHRMLTDACISALRAYRGWVLFYRSPSTLEFYPNLFVEIGPEAWERKLEAIAAHRSQAVSRPYLSVDALAADFTHWSSRYRGQPTPSEPFFIWQGVL